MNKEFLVLILAMFVNVAFSQSLKLSVSNKQTREGYIVTYIKYTDSVDFTKNSILYYFVEDEGFKNTNMKKQYDKYQKISEDKIFPYVRVGNIRVIGKNHRLPIFTDYLYRYYDILNYHSNYNDSGHFLHDIKQLVDSLESNNNNPIWKVFKRPYLRSNKEFGILYSMYKVKVEYYTVFYPEFEMYETEFLNTSNDLHRQKLIGLQGTSLCAKLEKLNEYDKGFYPTLWPIKVIQLK